MIEQLPRPFEFAKLPTYIRELGHPGGFEIQAMAALAIFIRL